MARKLGSDEQKLWGRVIDTVRPLHPVRMAATPKSIPAKSNTKPSILVKTKLIKHAANSSAKLPIKPSRPKTMTSLDGSWDKRIDRGAIVPDISVDLHGSALSGAYARLDGALEMAIAQRLKVVLLVTGKIRAHDRASGSGRGAIAAVVRDWIAASRHASHISAIRAAHPRHGGEGALYIVLKR